MSRKFKLGRHAFARVSALVAIEAGLAVECLGGLVGGGLAHLAAAAAVVGVDLITATRGTKTMCNSVRLDLDSSSFFLCSRHVTFPFLVLAGLGLSGLFRRLTIAMTRQPP